MKKILILFCALALSAITYAQVQTPQPSPLGKIEQMVGLTNINIEYSRPGMKGRKIFGDLVPYGQKWRTGANNNTTISFSDDVVIDGKTLPKGTYAIFTVPNQEKWEIIFYNDTKNWGLPENWDENKVALRTNAQVYNMPMKMETFTIVIDELQNNSAAINLLWEDTIAAFKVEVPTESKAMASIKQVMSGSKISANDYYSAANYYFEEGKDLKQALAWITKAVEQNGDEAFWVLRKKSLIEAKLGMREEAIATARRSLKSAQKANNQDYVKMNEQSLKEWGAKI